MPVDCDFVPDLDAYFRRIGDTGPRQPTLATLNRIAAAHTEAIPFENLDVLLGKPISVKPADIEHKLVHENRGGYCFEQNGLMLTVLKSLGYDVRPISARILFQKSRVTTPARTHMFLRVEVEDHSWLVDVGVGGLSLASVLKLELDTVQTTPHDKRRIVASGDWSGFHQRSPDAVLYHQVLLDNTWEDICEFTLEPMPAIDREIGNWYTSTNPDSHFLKQLMVARTSESGRVTLRNYELKHRDTSGRSDTRLLTSQDELLEVLDSEFHLHLPGVTSFGINRDELADPDVGARKPLAR